MTPEELMTDRPGADSASPRQVSDYGSISGHDCFEYYWDALATWPPERTI